MAVTVNKPIL